MQEAGTESPNARELAELRSQSSVTRRLTVPELEELLYAPIPVLDHGFVRVVDYMGGDAAIVQAARVSYGTGTRRLREDEGLIRYLLRNGHTTPFEMCELKLHVKLPIFVARQWIRHRTANVNEYSARYSILDKEFYIPERASLGSQSSVNRQGRTQGLSEEEILAATDILRHGAERAYDDYLSLLNQDAAGDTIDPERQGLARELARLSLNLNFYTQWYWKIDLHNLLHFLRLRLDDHAQFEIREYAKVIESIVKKWVPLTSDAFTRYTLDSLTLSSDAVEVLRRMLSGQTVTQRESGLSSTEWTDLMAVLRVKKTQA
jgi:thymidylate synthase (FAD)